MRGVAGVCVERSWLSASIDATLAHVMVMKGAEYLRSDDGTALVAHDLRKWL